MVSVDKQDTGLHFEPCLEIEISVFFRLDDREVSLWFKGTQGFATSYTGKPKHPHYKIYRLS